MGVKIEVIGDPRRYQKKQQQKPEALTKFNIERQATAFSGYQTFQVEAKTRDEAIALFKSDKCKMVEIEIEVLDLEPWDEIDFNDRLF